VENIPSLVQDLALILVTAGVVTLIFKKLKQPLVLGYIMAGFIVSPNFPLTVSVVDHENIEIWGNIGVMFLLFTLGLDFSFKKILKMGMAPIIAALTIVFSMMMIGILVSRLFGWSQMNGMFLAGMLAMSSTTIIYKAFDDMGLKQQQFAGLVMSVLILEDILAIVMMVMLGAFAGGGAPDGQVMVQTILYIGFIIIIWFVVGLFLIPTFLRRVRPLMNDEVLLIVALGMCCFMAVLSTKMGFSSAFGAFVMGSILAETVEAKKIEKVVASVKDLFGAIFFVSVGMLVDAHIIVDQWLAIAVITIAILLGQSIFGTFGFMLSGQPLRTAMRCGFSMAQIGEFAFIIASLGLSLHVLSDVMYPIVVTVSVVTTFLTPYMIRFAVPAYETIEKHIPSSWIEHINRISDIAPSGRNSTEGYWKPLLRQMSVNTLIYSCLSIAIIAFMSTFSLPIAQRIMPLHFKEWADIIVGAVTVLLMAPFLRAMVMKKNKSEEFHALWTSRGNRAPLIFTIIVRIIIAMAFVFYVCNMVTEFNYAILICVAMGLVILMIMSRWLKAGSIRMERLFIQNLRSKDYALRASGARRPLFEGRLLDRNIHIATVDVPHNSLWGGKMLKELTLGSRFGVHVSSIMRGYKKINIPSGSDIVFPLDQLNVIGTDEQLANLNTALQQEIEPEMLDLDGKDMQLKRFGISPDSPFVGKSLITSQLREKYNCMFVGLEEDEDKLINITPFYLFQPADIIWVVGEEDDIKRLAEDI
jgi:CPA2 family monovalent cation:H+ antiporter-2